MLSRREATSRAWAVLEEFDLGDRWDDRSDQESGGSSSACSWASASSTEPAW